MAKKNKQASPISNLIMIFTMIGIVALFYYQGPDQVYKTWNSFYGLALEKIKGTLPNTQSQTDTQPNSRPIQPQDEGLTNRNQNQTPSDHQGNETIAIQEQVQSERYIFTWKDASGMVHYTDRAPSDPEATIIKKTKKVVFKKPFKPVIETIKYKLPPETQRKVELATLKIYELYNNLLGIKSTDSLELKVKIFGDRNEFDAYRSLVAPRLENATGFYSGATREAALWRHDTPEQLLSVLTHEASHAIMHFKIGYAPAWIQEGFAEYFDSMRIYGQTIQVPLDKAWHEKLITATKDDRMPDFESFLQMSDNEFYSSKDNNHLNYAVAWSLIYFWMENERGRDLLHDLLYHWKHYRFGDPTEKVLRDYYPEGLEPLKSEWSAWLKRPRLSHRY